MHLHSCPPSRRGRNPVFHRCKFHEGYGRTPLVYGLNGVWTGNSTLSNGIIEAWNRPCSPLIIIIAPVESCEHAGISWMKCTT